MNIKEKLKKIFKYLGITLVSIFILLGLLLWGLFKENDTLLKRNVTSQGKTFNYLESLWGDTVRITGAWNTTYPNSAEISCDKNTMSCTIIQASLYSDNDMLDVYKEDFQVKEWSNNTIKAMDNGTQYQFELVINLKNEDVTYTKHPLSKKGVLGNNLETTTFKLYDGWIVDLNRQKLEVKEAKWWKAPLSKIFLFIFPLKEDSKIDLI